MVHKAQHRAGRTNKNSSMVKTSPFKDVRIPHDGTDPSCAVLAHDDQAGVAAQETPPALA